MTIAIPVGIKIALAGEVTVPVQLHTERNSTRIEFQWIELVWYRRVSVPLAQWR